MAHEPIDTLVIHPGALGDVLQAVPALEALGRLGHRLTFAGQPRLGELLQGAGLVLGATPFDTFGLEALFADGPAPERLTSRLSRFRRVVSWFGAREPDYVERLGALVPKAIVAPPVPDDESPLTVWEHLVETLGPWDVARPSDLHPLATTERWRIAARTALMALGVDESRPLLIAHPGAGARWKQAPTARFAQALERMVAGTGFEVVVHQGPADAAAVDALLAALSIPAHRFLEPTLTELAGALALAQAYLGSDSGVSHLAASVGTPSVILFPPETLRRWAPWAPSAVALGVGSEGDLP
ncbi:MAG TPA: glycosyltransferase family 9 protein [Methylomirabilota bacterium]|nr:glycosyltransferase family 9 protein [Methylomirabilota bacterium]